MARTYHEALEEARAGQLNGVAGAGEQRDGPKMGHLAGLDELEQKVRRRVTAARRGAIQEQIPAQWTALSVHATGGRVIQRANLAPLEWIDAGQIWRSWAASSRASVALTPLSRSTRSASEVTDSLSRAATSSSTPPTIWAASLTRSLQSIGGQEQV